MDDTTFDGLVTDLRGEEAPRVWSLLVTVFGDMAQDGSIISASVLGQITGRIGIKPEAMRVALHRLRKDGWIESERRGRSSDYRLSAQGRAESIQASPRIYDRKAPAGACWLVIADPAAATLPKGEGVWITPNIGMLTAVPPEHEVFARQIEDGADLPDWMRAKLCAPETMTLTRVLSQRLVRLTKALDGGVLVDPLQQTVLRVLIVHEWRRIVLKMPALPDHVLPTGWDAEGCRAKVGQLLDRLPRQRPEALDASLVA